LGAPGDTPLVKPIFGVLAASPELVETACGAVRRSAGAIEVESDVLPWRSSDYYRAEMGDDLCRRFIALAALEPADRLAERKRAANALEERWRDGRGRRVNLDPGYVDLYRLVLASTKDAAHRIYLRDGIWAEVTLRFERGGFRPYPHTYPDYADAAALAFFNRVRELYRRQRRQPPA
jgi:Domain of unknown function (DUF4416)